MDDKLAISPQLEAELKEALRVSSEYAQGRKMRLAQALASEIMSGNLDRLQSASTLLPTGEPRTPASSELGLLDPISAALLENPGLTREEAEEMARLFGF